MNDTIQNFILENSNIRGSIVHLNKSYETIMMQHHYPLEIQELLGQIILAATLLSSLIKFKGQLTIQYMSDNGIKLLVAKCDDQFHIRGLAQFDNTLLKTIHNLTDEQLEGQLVVTVQYEDKVKPYQSVIDINNQSIIKSVEEYFLRSEQLPTRLYLQINKDNATGLLLQLLPSDVVDDAINAINKEKLWDEFYELPIENILKKFNLHQAFSLMMQDQDQIEDIKVNSDLLREIFPTEDIRIFNARSVVFQCTCNSSRMKNAVIMLGYEEVQDILQQHKKVVVTCEFCNHSYAFDNVEIAAIFEK